MALWIFCTCSPVDLSICPAWLTGPDVNILYQSIMGIPYLFTWRPVNLSIRVDRFRGKYRSSSAFGYSVLFHLSTCLPGFTGQDVNI